MGAVPGARHEAGSPPKRAWTRPGSVHSPGDDDGMLPFDDLHFHRYCAVLPFYPDDDPALPSSDADEGRDDIRIVSGVARAGLRHTPMIVLLVTLVFFISAELSGEVQGVSVFLPPLSEWVWVGLAAAGGINVLLVIMVIKIGLITPRELYKALVVYGLMGLLVVGTVASIALVVLDHSLAVDRNIVFTSGYLLMLLMAGLLVYDGALRTEHMFEHLEDTHVIGDPDRYDEFKVDLKEKLDHTLLDRPPLVVGPWSIPVRVPTAYAFAVLFVSQYVVTWSIGVGPQNLAFPVTLWGNVLLNLFIVAIFFQFLVLINGFYRLVTDDLNGDGSALTYRPFHPDGHGGYRDFGKFATRVNVLLIIAGLYSVYRLIVQGGRVTPAQMAPGFDPFIGSLLWTHSFVLPLVVYAIAVVGWFYYSFWQLHLRMIRERENAYLAATDTFDDATDWEIRTDGPTWPTDFHQLVSIVSGTLVPVVFFLLEIMG